MVNFLLGSCLLIGILGAIYSPVIYQYGVVRRARKEYQQALAAIFTSCVKAIDTQPALKKHGEGESQNSDVAFEKAVNNISFAVGSVECYI